MLDVRLVHPAACEREVGLDRLPGVVGVAHDQPADDEHPVAVDVLDGRDGRVAGLGRCSRSVFLAPRPEESEVVVQDVLDARGRRSGTRPGA